MHLQRVLPSVRNIRLKRFFAAPDRFGIYFFGSKWLFEHLGLPTPDLVHRFGAASANDLICSAIDILSEIWQDLGQM